jgi:hypothetical protein
MSYIAQYGIRLYAKNVDLAVATDTVFDWYRDSDTIESANNVIDKALEFGD